MGSFTWKRWRNQNPFTQIQCFFCRALLRNTNADEKTQPWKNRIKLKMKHIENGGRRRHLRQMGDSETRWQTSSGTANAGAEFPLLWCQHLFARPRGADPIFTGRQLVCFEMIGFNLLSFEATYLWGPSKTCFASGKTSPAEFPLIINAVIFPAIVAPHAHTHTNSFALAPTLIVSSSAGRFCVGDKFFLKNNMILCQMDYEEGQLNGSFETQVQ